MSSDLSTNDFNIGPGETADLVDRFILSAQGESLSTSLTGDDMYMYKHFKTTVNANGAMTVFFDAPKFACQ